MAPPRSSGNSRGNSPDQTSVSTPKGKESKSGKNKDNKSTSHKGGNSKKWNKDLKMSNIRVPNHVFIVICAIIALGVLKYAGEQNSMFEGLKSNRSAEETVDHYEVLGLKPAASISDIRKSYMKLARQNHPDTCPDCEDTFQRIALAYQVLSNPTSRQAYDSSNADLNIIESNAVQVTNGNVAEIFGTHPFVVIQIYNDWSRDCVAFSHNWERAVERLNSYMFFGRLHDQRDAKLISSLIPVRIRFLPALAVFVNGKFSRLIPTGIKYAELDQNLVDEYPNMISSVNTVADVSEIMSQKSGQRAIIFTASGRASMLIKYCGMLFKDIVSISITSIKPSELSEGFNIAGQIANSNMVLYNNDGVLSWIPIASPENLIPLLRAQISRGVITFDSAWQYQSICRSDLDCVLLMKCSGATNLTSAFSDASNPTRTTKIQGQSPIQFAIVDATRVPALKPFCPTRSDGVVAIHQGQSMAAMPAPYSKSSMSAWFRILSDIESRQTIEFEPCPLILAATVGGLDLRWIFGIVIVLVAFALFTSLSASKTVVVVVMGGAMVTSLIMQFDWLLPLFYRLLI